MMLRKRSTIKQPKFGLVRGASPVRRIRPRTGRLSMPGWHPTFKGSLDRLRVETQVEADGLEIFEFDPEVVMMAAQPHRLLYHHPQSDGSTIVRRYYPDLALLDRNGRVTIVDFKVERYAQRPAWRAKEKLLQEAYLLDHGAAFLTITKEQIAVEPRRGNARILSTFRKLRDPSLWDQAGTVDVLAALERIGLPAKLGHLRRLCRLPSVPGVDRTFIVIMNLIADEVLDFDRSRPIDDDVAIRWPDSAGREAFVSGDVSGAPNADPMDWSDPATAAKWGVA